MILLSLLHRPSIHPPVRPAARRWRVLLLTMLLLSFIPLTHQTLATAAERTTPQATPLATTTVVAWGWNIDGQLNVPPGLHGGIQIAAGAFHTVARTSNDTVVAWGGNADGQLNVPAGLHGVVQVAAGYGHTLALKGDGTVVTWGRNTQGQLNVPVGLRGVVQAAAGSFHTVALRSDGSVVAWGGNADGQTTVPADLRGVVQVAAGGYHTVALKGDGTVVAWGRNTEGQRTVPVGLSGVVQIAAGRFHTVALKGDGTVVAWGGNAEGQTTVPADLRGVVQVVAGGFHTLAVTGDDTVVAWGWNQLGQTTVPAGLHGVIQVAGGDAHTVALVEQPPVFTSAASTTFTYGQAGVFPVTTTQPSTFSANDLPAWASLTASGVLSGTPPRGSIGSHPLTLTASTSTATVTQTFTLIVAPAALTATAHLTRPYGATTMPPVTYTGWVGSDTAADLETPPTVRTSATTSSPVGSYPLTLHGGSDIHYQFVYVPGTLTIIPATPSLTWATPAAIPAGTALGPDQLTATADVAGTFSYTPAAGTVLAVGNYPLRVSFTPTDTTNYTTATHTVTLTIIPRTSLYLPLITR